MVTNCINGCMLCRTLQMLAAIENKMEELFEVMESLPIEKIEAAEKVSRGRLRL